MGHLGTTLGHVAAILGPKREHCLGICEQKTGARPANQPRLLSDAQMGKVEKETLPRSTRRWRKRTPWLRKRARRTPRTSPPRVCPEVINNIAEIMEVIAALELTLGEGWCGHLKDVDSWAKQATEALDAEVKKVVTLLGLELEH